uniref:Cmr4 n=2 Tax=Oscillatoriales TaxID=1150 RepID=W0FKZ1_9CYAN|nr:Cmr4 [uncultured Phormidium sp.]
MDLYSSGQLLNNFKGVKMMVFDPRTIATPVYEALAELRQQHNGNDSRLKEQKNQAVELYTYLSTWGMMRLKAEEQALTQDGKKDVVKKYFDCLQRLSGMQNLSNNQGLKTLIAMDIDEYLGITGLGLAIAQEFSFWATAVYHDIKGEN